MRTEFRVPCTTGTYADTLVALGLAKLLRALGAESVRIQRSPEMGYFLISSRTPVEDASKAPFQHLFPRIVTKGERVSSASDIDYEAEKDKRARFFKWKKDNSEAKSEQVGGETIPEPPRKDFRLISSLVDMLKSSGEDSYEKTSRLLRSHFGIYVETALQVFAGPLSNKVMAVDEILGKVAGEVLTEKEVTTAQIFTPISPKGMWAEKPNRIGLKNLKGFIPIEMLKFSGWWQGAIAVIPKLSDDPKKNKDLKVLVVSPTDISAETLQAVMNDLHQSFFYGPVQVDILASLRLTEVLLQYNEAVPSRRGKPSSVISGFNTAYFKSLGNAKGLVNLSFIGLPEWVEVRDDPDRQLWLEVLREHKSILSRLDESRSEAHSLLEQYRDFLSLGLLEHFLEFLVDYGAYALAVADRNKPIQWFNTNLLRRVFMGLENETGNLSEILENPGFQNIARAIRLSTRGALYARKPPVIKGQSPKQPDRTYEVRYGLAQELKRKAVYKSEFAAALAGFISEYMTENLRVADRTSPERPLPQRPAVTTTDLEQVIALMDKHDSETVAMLLIAYGYAKEPRDADELVTDDLPQDENMIEGDDDQ
jgi:hypothetical protein